MPKILTKEDMECGRPHRRKSKSGKSGLGEWSLPLPAKKKMPGNCIVLDYKKKPEHHQIALQRFIRWQSKFLHENTDANLTQLESAARVGNEQAFLAALKEVNFNNRTVEDFIYMIKLALQAGAHLGARHISVEGITRFPDDPDIQRYARGLAPPRVISRNLPPNPTLRANREWLRTYSERYRGQWVAIQNGQLLGTASSLKELTKQIPDRDNILFTKVR